MKSVLAWLVGAVAVLLRATCRTQFHNDPRPFLARNGQNHLVAILHAHQAAASVAAERGTAVIVSRSEDGDIVVPTVRIAGCIPIRGSAGRASKGGSRAMKQLIHHVRDGRPAAFTVDGPLGPRGRVHPGVALLSQKTGSPVVPLLLIPSRRMVLTKTWDRLQIPIPFSRIHIFCGPAVFPRPDEALEDFVRRIGDALSELDRRHDPDEAAFSRGANKAPKASNRTERSRQVPLDTSAA